MRDPEADRRFNEALIADFRAHGGHASSGPFVGRQVLLLTTIGAKTGRPRTSPLIYTLDSDHYIIVASNGASPTHPAWYLNIVAHLIVTVEVGAETFQATATIAQGTERRRLYDQHAAYMSAFAEYEKKTDREIPLVVLARLGASPVGTSRDGFGDEHLAALSGTAPLEASSAGDTRHRLNRGGNRRLNLALHRIVLIRGASMPSSGEAGSAPAGNAGSAPWQWAFRRIYELGFPLTDEMPRLPGFPPFVVATNVAHGEGVLADGSSGANEVLLTGTHTGSHLDGFAHVSSAGLVRGGLAAEDVQTRWGIRHLDMESVGPLVAPGYLIDVAGARGVEVLHGSASIGEPELRSLDGRDLTGAVVLLRTGWGAVWTRDPRTYASLRAAQPGLSLGGAAALADRGALAVGTDAFNLEGGGATTSPVHVELLVRRGVYVFESLNLEEVAAAGESHFLFVALPLRLRGATGSPVRPIAIV